MPTGPLQSIDVVPARAAVPGGVRTETIVLSVRALDVC